jgi:hypothetical protein
LFTIAGTSNTLSPPNAWQSRSAVSSAATACARTAWSLSASDCRQCTESTTPHTARPVASRAARISSRGMGVGLSSSTPSKPARFKISNFSRSVLPPEHM